MLWLYRQYKRFRSASTRDLVFGFYVYVGTPIFVLVVLDVLIKVL